MAKKIENLWEDAINKKNEEVIKKREASDFFNEVNNNDNKEKKVNEVEKVVDVTMSKEAESLLLDPKPEVIEKEKIVYTSYKPIENTSNRKSLNRQNDVLGAELYDDEEDGEGWKTFGVLFTSFFAALVLLSLASLAITSLVIIENAVTARELMGYEVNETKFAVKHNESGLYLQNPTYEGEQASLGEEWVNTFMFYDDNVESEDLSRVGVLGRYDDFWLKSSEIFNNQKMFLSTVKGVPSWTGMDNDGTIHLKKKSDSENLFSISLNNEELFIAKDDESNRLELSRVEDWFSFEAQVNFIKDEEDYMNDFNFLNNGASYSTEESRRKDNAFSPTFGPEGNPVMIRSTRTGKYINSYKAIEHSKLPSLDISKNEYLDSIYLSDETDTNMFIQSSPDGEMVFSAFQTLPFEYFYDKEVQPWKQYYPILSIDAVGRPALQMYDLTSFEEGTTRSIFGTDISNGQFWLLQNPNNLWEKAIYFPNSNSFLNTRDGKLTTEKISISLDELDSTSTINDLGKLLYDEILNLDFFNIKHSQNENIEHVNVQRGQTFNGTNRTVVGKTSKKTKFIDGYEFYGFGYETWNEAHENPENYFTEVRDLADSNKGKGKVKLRRLEPRTTYQGIMAIYRNEDSGIGKHVTFEYVKRFETKDPGFNWPSKWPNLPSINWPDIDWPNIDWPNINWPWIDPVDPGNPIEGNPPVVQIWDSTDEDNSRDYVNDVPIAMMIDNADEWIEVSLKLVEQGTFDGITDKLAVKLEEVDDMGVVIEDGYFEIEQLTNSRPTSGDTYSCIFTNLEPETKYKASVIYYDGKYEYIQTQDDPLTLDDGQTQMWLTTERVAPTTKKYDGTDGSSIVNFTKDGITFGTTLSEYWDTDELRAVVIDHSTDDIYDTGWIKTVDWTGQTTQWSFDAISPLPNHDGAFTVTFKDINETREYSVYMWARMETPKSFEGWDEYSPAFDDEFVAITGESPRNVIKLMSNENVSISPTKVLPKIEIPIKQYIENIYLSSINNKISIFKV